MKNITYSKFGLMGRLGNQMFQIASLFGMSKRYGREWHLPSFAYQQYFEYTFPIGPKEDFKTEINEPHFHHEWEYWDKKMDERAAVDVANIGGWLQSAEYWKGAEDEVKNMFAFKNSFFTSVRTKYAHLFNNNKETIAISMRVGNDYKVNGNYEILPVSYYISALYEKFPSWREYNILLFCDDMQYAGLNFQGENVHMAPIDFMEQLCLGTMCKHFILSNSTFSWWMAYLGEKEGSKIVFPSKYYKAELGKSCNTKDFWPKHWEIWPYNKKVNAKDVTFTIPITIDSPDRSTNFMLCIAYLRKHFDTNILVGEHGSKHLEEGHYAWMHFPYINFHRTKMLNEMANESNTKIIVNQDVDVITPVFQMVQAIDAVRNGVDMVFPYDGRMARVPRNPYISDFARELDVNEFRGDFKGTRAIDPPSVGGVILWNKESFVFGGMENEHMINYGPEDVERVERMKKLGYKVHRISGITYHLDHWVGPNSGGAGNPFYQANYDEMERIRAMSNEQLLDEIAKWPWVNQYMGAYYEEINDGSIRSAKEIFAFLEEKKKFSPINTIIDVGCGVGSWKLGIKDTYDYYGVDLKVPRHRLVFPESRYGEFDLNTPTNAFPFPSLFDVAICCEVGEHLKPESARWLVQLLCKLSHTVLFSAAIPHQGGNGHLNEQWQTYWCKLFELHGFYGQQFTEIKNNTQIEPWYRQNLVLYTRQHKGQSNVEDYVLPDMYTNIIGSLTDWK